MGTYSKCYINVVALLFYSLKYIFVRFTDQLKQFEIL